jgi:cytochrome b involved in lipid metabolism
MGISSATLQQTFDTYNQVCKDQDDKLFGKKYFHNFPFVMDDIYNVAIVTPVIHYCMGGIYVSAASEVLRENGEPIPGLWCTGEAMGGTHGINRLGGSSLLDCVVFGRVSGRNAANFLMRRALHFQRDAAEGRLANVLGHLTGDAITTTISQGGVNTTIRISPEQNRVSVDFAWGEGSHIAQAPTSHTSNAPSFTEKATATETPAEVPVAKREITLDEVAKHNNEKDCWLVVNGEVLDVTTFMHDHPGGKKAILLFAGKDASEEFNMLHKPDVVAKYAPESILGTLKH